jgi:hypothetical protein
MQQPAQVRFLLQRIVFAGYKFGLTDKLIQNLLTVMYNTYLPYTVITTCIIAPYFHVYSYNFEVLLSRVISALIAKAYIQLHNI